MLWDRRVYQCYSWLLINYLGVRLDGHWDLYGFLIESHLEAHGMVSGKWAGTHVGLELSKKKHRLVVREQLQTKMAGLTGEGWCTVLVQLPDRLYGGALHAFHGHHAVLQAV